MKTKITTLPTTEDVEYARAYSFGVHHPQWDAAAMYLERVATDDDKDRGCPQMAAAARILAAEVERLRAQEDAVCERKQHEQETFGWDVWATQCGRDVSYDTPTPQDYQFCPGCGRRVKIVEQQQTNEQ